MVRQYRQTRYLDSKQITGTFTQCFYIEPIDSEQVPTAYLDSIKVSVVDSRGEASSSFLIAATTDDQSVDDDIITAGATPEGGGTVWLKMKRSIRSNDNEEDRNDGRVNIMILSQSETEIEVVAEVWGRFVELVKVP